jgi:uncharacterized damage-inducible protein DinB
MSDERSLRDLYAYNAWANAFVFDQCQNLDRAQLEQQAPGTIGTLDETLKHLVRVEDAYVYMLRGDPLERMEPREEYVAHDLTWFAQRAAQLGGEYAALLASADAGYFDGALDVPWFDFALTKRDGLHQVLNHSAQHRAQVFSVLGERGMEVPDLDYVLFVQSRQTGQG